MLLQPISALLSNGDTLPFMHNGKVLHALQAEAETLHKAKQYAPALAWGKLAYAASRRFVHGWLTFIEIAAAAGCLPGFDPLAAAPRGQQGLIPRAIVQFWDKPEPPADVAALIDGWRTNTPGYEHRLFNDITARQFIGECYGQNAASIYDMIEHVAGKSDLFRLAWIAEHGGIYIDADDRCVGDVGLLLPATSDLVLNWSPGPPPCVNNWFVAARPKHPVILHMLAEALSLVPAVAARGLRLAPWIVTGPGLYSMTLLDEVTMAEGVPERLRDFCFQREVQYRSAVQPVHDLNYRSDRKANWKLAY
jgi:mannosyltransferase OCH1-like enzyme